MRGAEERDVSMAVYLSPIYFTWMYKYPEAVHTRFVGNE